MQIESGVSLKPFNTFHLPAVARTLVRIECSADVTRVVDHPKLGPAPKFVLGGGSNIILTRDMPQVVLKIEVPGMRLVEERADAWVVEAGAGVGWHEFVAYTLANGWPGLENLALIPGTVGAAPVQNIGAYGVELKEKELTVWADSDFQIGQVMDVLIAKLTKRSVDIRFLDRTAKIEKIGGDKVKQLLLVKSGIDSDSAKKIQTVIKQSKLKVQAAIQGDTVRVTGTKRDELQAAMALVRKEMTDAPLSFNNFRD